MLKIISKYILFICALTVIVIAYSCSPQQRLSNIISKHPELLKADSTTKTDTVFIPGAKSEVTFEDSALQIATKENPVVIDSNGVHTTIYEEHKHVHIHTDCPPTINIKTIVRTRNYYQTVHHIYGKWYWYLICFLAGGIIVLIIKR
jgi:hypothetical protein